MGYSDSTINLLPKAEIEDIVKNGIPKEQYANRIVTQAMTDNKGFFWALPGDPIAITSISSKGVEVGKINGKSSIFITFNQLTTLTAMSTAIKTQVPVVKQTEDTKTVLKESTDLAQDVVKKEINKVEDRIKNADLKDLETDVFNSKIC